MAASGAFGADGAAFAATTGSFALAAGAYLAADLAGAGVGLVDLASLAFGA